MMYAAKEVIRERIKIRDGVPFMWRLLVIYNIHSKLKQELTLLYIFFAMRKRCRFWLQEKSYSMEGNAEAESSAGERAKKLESCYF